MKTPYESEDRAQEPVKPHIHVELEVTVIPRHVGYAELVAHRAGCPPERSLGHDTHRVRRKLPEHTLDVLTRKKRKTYLRIERQGYGPELSRFDNCDAMSARLKYRDERL